MIIIMLATLFMFNKHINYYLEFVYLLCVFVQLYNNVPHIFIIHSCFEIISNVISLNDNYILKSFRVSLLATVMLYNYHIYTSWIIVAITTIIVILNDVKCEYDIDKILYCIIVVMTMAVCYYVNCIECMILLFCDLFNYKWQLSKIKILLYFVNFTTYDNIKLIITN